MVTVRWCYGIAGPVAELPYEVTIRRSPRATGAWPLSHARPTLAKSWACSGIGLELPAKVTGQRVLWWHLAGELLKSYPADVAVRASCYTACRAAARISRIDRSTSRYVWISPPQEAKRTIWFRKTEFGRCHTEFDGRKEVR